MAELIKIDKNGTKYYRGLVTCDRCGGKGYYAIGVRNGQPVLSPVDGGVCFKCAGRGKVVDEWKEYTPEYWEKLEKRRKKRAEKQAEAFRAKQAELEKERKAEEERLRQEEEKEREEKAKSKFFGNEGDRIEEKAIYKFSAWYLTKDFYGFGEQTNYIHNFKIGDNTVVWKTTKPLGLEKESKVILRGTIKDHNEYKGEKQTILTRCKVTAEG